MMLKLNNFLNWIKSHKVWSIVVALAILGAIMFFTSGKDSKGDQDFVLAEMGTIREEVSVTGNVKPLSEVDLAFERSGRVASLNVSVGDRVNSGQTLASVSNADLVASLDQAKANLKKVRASLGSDAEIAALEYSQARTLLFNTIKDSYTKSDDAVRNKVFTLFNDPNRYNSKLLFNTSSFLQEDIEDGKQDVTESLDAWERSLRGFSTSSDLEAQYNLAKTNLVSIKSLLDKSADAVNGLTVASDGVSQTQIDTWKLNISSARTSINSTIDSLTSSYNNLNSANLSTKISGRGTLAEEASVEQAAAQVASAEAELAKTIIRSPISGVVTDIPIKLGEIVSLNQKAVSVISYGDYEVESFVPEADISKIKLGNNADVTLDAYGSGVNFDTTVIKVDPAATVIDGVPTYKVTLRFNNQDERVRSGMTANLDILTAEKENVLVVPARAVYSRDDGRYVKVVNQESTLEERKVEIGLRGFDGRVEVISGLNEGEKVSTAL
jgi:HlyD family secretion protein